VSRKRVQSILFVCTGNICRSPLAQGLMEQALAERGLAERFRVDSAGTHAHVGEMPHVLSVTVGAVDYGIDITSQRGRQILREDFTSFDWMIALDSGHLAWMEQMRPADSRASLRLLLGEEAHPQRDVPDPYGRRREAFEISGRLIKQGVDRLLDTLVASAAPRARSRTAPRRATRRGASS
jgi:protein-tyrosine phosphatase